VSAFLAGERHAKLAGRGRHAIFSAALAAGGLDPGVALLDGDGLLLHRLFDQAVGLRTHRFFGHELRLSGFHDTLLSILPDASLSACLGGGPKGCQS
jgi:hypothetical protein